MNAKLEALHEEIVGVATGHLDTWLREPPGDPCDRCGEGAAEHEHGDALICTQCADAIHDRHEFGDA